MSLKTDLQTQITDLQTKLAFVNRIPEDTFNLGTIVVFASGLNGAVKWYYVKTAEETWKTVNGSSAKDLATWIYETYSTQGVGYFEVYVLNVGTSPIFASS